uniref:Uncharacterized protein n=1 Tax=Candidatus Kentrum sp. TUN TaxID=2126343 RepID=A0A450ZN96_9GAMM|nr:MAG: hypothetical protein BECKTUN1418D_GA0071000_10309 [Candidatus Kentron sp. TUN]
MAFVAGQLPYFLLGGGLVQIPIGLKITVINLFISPILKRIIIMGS